MSLLPAAGAAAGAAAVGAAAVGAAAAGAGIAASAITETTRLAATDGFRPGKALRNGAFVNDVVKWGPFTQEQLQDIRKARAHNSPEPPSGVQIENARSSPSSPYIPPHQTTLKRTGTGSVFHRPPGHPGHPVSRRILPSTGPPIRSPVLHHHRRLHKIPQRNRQSQNPQRNQRRPGHYRASHRRRFD